MQYSKNMLSTHYVLDTEHVRISKSKQARECSVYWLNQQYTDNCSKANCGQAQCDGEFYVVPKTSILYRK